MQTKTEGKSKENMEYRHGGERYGKAVRLDFSVNTNPLGLPDFVKKRLTDPACAAKFAAYPDADCHRLRELLAKEHGVCAEQILCGNGASELLYALAAQFRGGRGVLLSPCFGEYERAFLAGGVTPLWYDRSRKEQFAVGEDFWELLRREKPELVLLCNPGNPMGELFQAAFLEKTLLTVRSYGGVLAVDECFLTLAQREELSMIRQIGDSEGLLVLRAFTKTYAMAGLRLGYLVGGETLLSEIRQSLPEWNVSVPAQEAGICVLEEQEKRTIYIEETQSVLQRERRFLEKGLGKLSIRCSGGAANYLFFRADAGLYERMLERGILIRQCGNYRGLDVCDYRIAVRTHAENEALLAALTESGEKIWQK